jgi:ATP-dependent exoDNAse (exonuclease V) beta subunit
MITRAHLLLAQDEGLLTREREHARFILVDEFQDANFAQVKILQKLEEKDQTYLRSAIRIRPSFVFVVLRALPLVFSSTSFPPQS